MISAGVKMDQANRRSDEEALLAHEEDHLPILRYLRQLYSVSCRVCTLQLYRRSIMGCCIVSLYDDSVNPIILMHEPI